ncbi:flavodoxin [Sedimentibacter hydroxybenzoicus DSM 7310]|uniref:Flavodoxin n=1 Tax=Sedimentibacter hydroxybenzoicus DSM 7310 TaxID=1123245 RepID=A0A974BLV7_SEDHY|nr:flavodoxin domain-containing protein [Sedimentibacter hydroxybenzoicus]NYB75780.1 flavodoxin [Sedimentibacter hydroxybenzoicus DSM 7310]
MKILIAYAGNNNTTQDCANILKNKLHNAHVINLAKQQPDISDYDTIIIGSCIRFNEIHNLVKIFIRDNMNLLMKKNTAIYICCGFPEKANQYLLHNFPKKLLNKSFSIQCFGGNLKVKPYKILDLMIMKIVQKNFKTNEKSPTKIIEENILEMVNDIEKLSD